MPRMVSITGRRVLGMPRNASGTYALPSSVNPVVTGTPATAAWANVTMGDLGNELTQSLDRNGKGAMLAPLRVPAGSSAAPALSFSAETNSGLYRAGAGDLRLAIGGTDRATFTAASLTIAGALTASGVVKAGDGATGAPAFSFGSETNSGMYRASAGDVRIAIAGADRLSITASLISAAAAVTVLGAGTVQGGLTVTQSTTNGNGASITGNGTGAGASITGGSGGGTGLQVTAGGTNGAGMTIQGKGTGTALAIDANAGGATGVALQLTGNTTKAPLKLAVLLADPSSGAAGEIAAVSVAGVTKLKIYDGSAWVVVGTQT